MVEIGVDENVMSSDGDEGGGRVDEVVWSAPEEDVVRHPDAVHLA